MGSRKKVVAIVQARMGSSRLPGKTLFEIGPLNETLLEVVLSRLKLCELLDEIVVATTYELEDDQIESYAKILGASVFRGSTADVLGRYYEAAQAYGADVVVRITADDPFKDPTEVDAMVRIFAQSNLDYLSNNFDTSLPEGLDVEIISFDALKESFFRAVEPYEREHITQWIRESTFGPKIAAYKSPLNWPACRLTIDHPSDSHFARLVLQRIKNGVTHSTSDLCALMWSDPNLIKINLNVAVKNEGLILSKGYLGTEK